MSIKHETITLEGTVLYCDECDARGPQAAYDNPDEVLELGETRGWTQNDDGEDLCPTCRKKAKDNADPDPHEEKTDARKAVDVPRKAERARRRRRH